MKKSIHFLYKLSKRGNVLEPLHQSFWGATCGSFTDNLGIK